MYCPSCGSVNSDDATFCATCGSVLTTIANGDALAGSQEPLFLYISVTRLILMSVASVGFYEAYWIYKNWKYINEREGRGLHPFWRGIFGVFFCHSLLGEIKKDKAASALIEPSFSVHLATGWVILTILTEYIIGPFVSIPGIEVVIVMPSYLFFVPVQKYINLVTEKRSPGAGYYGWSAGHIVCLILGLPSWATIIFFLFQ